MDLHNIAKEIRDILDEKRNELELEFFEDEHIYHMRDLDGTHRDDFPSVSKVIKKFYNDFDKETKARQMSKGDESKMELLLEEWSRAGDYSTNMGSRVHYMLETELIKRYGDYKEVRQPLFTCDTSQIMKGNQMIIGGNQFLDLMEERNAVLLDTEIVLGDPELGYVGQPDKCWIMLNKEKTDFGFVITDWKTNKEKNFQVHSYTDKMLPPFQHYDNTSLGHYYVQLPLYGKLLLKMLEGSKYENKKLLGCVIVHLKDNGTFVEYKVPSDVTNKILTMNVKKYLK
jgi:hypothetical protein